MAWPFAEAASLGELHVPGKCATTVIWPPASPTSGPGSPPLFCFVFCVKSVFVFSKSKQKNAKSSLEKEWLHFPKSQ